MVLVFSYDIQFLQCSAEQNNTFSQTLLTEDISTCQCRRSTGGITNINAWLHSIYVSHFQGFGNVHAL